MSTVTYAFPGDETAITLEMIRTRGIHRQAVYSDDGTTYLYTKWLVDVTGIINPAATSYDLVEDGEAILPVPNVRRSVTDRFIRHVLMQPRGVFTWLDDDGETLVQCPDEGHDVDAAGGPHPRAFDILQVQGSEGFLARYLIELHVNECENDPLILAHRFEMQEAIDNKGLSTRVVESTVDFNVAAIYRFGFLPDQLRPLLVHRTPLGFKREHLDITQASDWKRMHILSVDRQLSHSWGAGLLDVRAWSTRGYASGGRDLISFANIANATMQGAMAGWSAGGIAGAVGANNPFLPGSGVAGWGAGAASGAAFWGGVAFLQAAAMQAISELPTYLNSVHVQCQGGPESQRWDVENAAMQIAIAAMTSIDPAFTRRKVFLPAVDAVLRSELTGKYAEFTYTARYGPGVANTYYGPFMVMRPRNKPPDYEKLLDKQGNPLITTDRLPIPGPANALGTRTTWLGALVANFLQDACTPAGAPGNYSYPNAAVPQPQQPNGVDLQQEPPPETGGADLDPPPPNP